MRGVGTLIMNHLKEYVKTIRLTHFLTYADNFAIGYFRKQGFTKYITMPKERWRAYIKDYDGGTLMECAVNEYVDYTAIPKMVAAQRRFLYRKIKAATMADVVWPGLQVFREGQQITNLLEQVPGVKEAGWAAPMRGVHRTMRVAARPVPPAAIDGLATGAKGAKAQPATGGLVADDGFGSDGEHPLASGSLVVLRNLKAC